MSLVEAIEHIQVSQPCDSVEASRQFKQELRDGMIGLQWEDSEEPNDCPDPEYLQASQLLLIGSGLAPDKDQGKYRSLLVESDAVLKLWPLSDQRRKDSCKTESSSNNQPEMPARRPAPEADILRVARELYQQPGKPPNLSEAEQQLMAKFPGTSREPFVRSILRREEFARLRLKRGNQPKS